MPAASKSSQERAPGLVLSLFPGADLFGRGFEAEGYCVVRGPDKLWGQDVCDFAPARHAFEGIIGGPPCQDFSSDRHGVPPTGNGLAMLAQFARVVIEADPEWFVMENVPAVPDIVIPGYTIQRFNLNASECGGNQNRLRCFQFGSKDGARIVPRRSENNRSASQPCCMASKSGGRTFEQYCELQGLPKGFALDGWSKAAKYAAVGNGVPVYMARVVAAAVRLRNVTRNASLCACGCGREVPVNGRRYAVAGCRKRAERKRERDAAGVTIPGVVTAAQSPRGGSAAVTARCVTQPSTSQLGLFLAS